MKHNSLTTPEHKPSVPAWRLFEWDSTSKVCKTLFHGVNGSRAIEDHKWHRANLRIVSDGGRRYRGGFHVFDTYEKAVEYSKKFNPIKGRTIIVQCVAVDSVRRRKPTNPDVSLAKWMWLH